MGKNKKWHIILYSSIVVYIAIVIGIFIFLQNISSLHNKNQREYEKEVKQKIQLVLESNTDINKGLKEIYNNERLELVVIDKNDNIIFQSLKFDKIENLNKNINNNVVGNKAMYKVDVNKQSYFVWVNIYFQDLQVLYNNLVYILCVVIISLITVLAIIIMLLYRKMVNPLKMLDQNIRHLKNYEFKDILSKEEYTEYDALSKGLIDFANNINQSIKVVEDKYMGLENELSRQKNVEIYKIELVRTLIHDLKTPISLVILNLEYNKKISGNQLDFKESVKILEDLPNEINNIMKILNNDEVIELEYEKINVVELVNQIFKYHYPLIEEKNIYYEFIGPEYLDVVSSYILLKQIFNNIFSNCIKYTSENRSIEISLFESDNNIEIIAKNDSEYISEDEIKDIFNLFSKVDKESEGSGSGLFIVKNLVEYMNGSVTFSYSNGEAILKIILPKSIK